MAITAKPYMVTLQDLAYGDVKLAYDDLKVALMTPDYVPDYLYHYNFLDINTNEVNEDDSENYSYGGQVFPGRNIGFDSVAGTYMLLTMPNPVVFTDLTATFRFVIVYADRFPASKPTICCIDMGETLAYTNETFTLNFPDGWFKIAAG